MGRAMKTSMMAALMAMAAGLGACAPSYGGFECEILNDTPSPATCTERGIAVAQGEALVLRLRAESDTRTEYEGAEVELRSTEPAAATVRRAARGDQTVIGLTEGDTVLEVLVDGVVEAEVPLTVRHSEPSGPSN